MSGSPAADELAARYGSPLYVYDLPMARAALRELRSQLPPGLGVYYSLKANPHPLLVAALATASAAAGAQFGVDVSSVGELDAALAAGVAADACLYTGPGKTTAEIEAALDSGVVEFSVESLAELRRIGQLVAGRPARCLIRVNGLAGGTSSMRMTGRSSQFGVDLDVLQREWAGLASIEGVEIAGLHLYSLSNARDEAALIAEFEQSLATVSALYADADAPPAVVDIGGGFAAAFAAPAPRAGYPTLRRELERSLDRHLPSWRGGATRVICESGRYLAGGCGALVCSVTDVKYSRGTKFVVLDAGVNALGGMSALGRLLPLRCVPHSPQAGAATAPATLVGPLCTPADVLGRDVELPAGIEAGDVITVPNVGAYGLTASLLGFLGRPLPAEIVIDDDVVVDASRVQLTRSPIDAHAELVR